VFGGSRTDSVTAIATDPSGFVITGGITSSFDFPVTDGSRNTATQFSASPDDGAGWAPVSNLPAGTPIDFQMDTGIPAVWYAASTQGLFKSTDQGATWTEIGPHTIAGCGPGCVTGIAINPAQPSILYARSYLGLLKSTDSGATWSTLSPPTNNPNPFSYVTLDPFQPDHVFTGIGGIYNYRSFDGGMTWSAINEPAPHPGDSCGNSLTFDRVAPGLAYLANHCDLFVSSDGGVSWQVLATPFARNPARAVTHPTRGGTVYVIAGQGLYGSTDAGNSWTVFYGYNYGAGPTTVAVDPAHPDTILTSDARSVDGGMTWSPLPLGRSADAILFDRANPGRVIVSSSGASTGFLAKVNSAGNIMAATYLGGQGATTVAGVTTDGDGSIYVTGTTRSFDFPITPGSYQSRMPFIGAVPFAAKLDASLNLVYATFVPGIVQVSGIAVDRAGSAVIVGWNLVLLGCQVLKLTPDGMVASFLVQFAQTCSAVAVDPSNNIVVTGSNGHGFVAKFDTSGMLLFLQTVGTDPRDVPLSLAVDAFGAIYLTGDTTSTSFPVTAGAYQSRAGTNCSFGSPGGGFLGPGIGISITQNLYVNKFDPGGNLIDSTYLGTGCDTVRSVAVDGSGKIWLTGTSGNQFPQVMPFESGPAGGGHKAFVAGLNADGASLALSSYFGSAVVITVDRFGNIWVGGTQGGHASLGKIQTQYPEPLAIRTAGNLFGRRDGPVSPGQLTLINVDGLAPDIPQDLTLTPDNFLPRTLSGVEVLFDGEAAALVSVLPGQVVAIAPYDLGGRLQTTVQVVVNGAVSRPMIADVLPDLAYLSADGSGAGRALARNPDGTLNTPDNPAPSGQPVTVYATGIGSADLGCPEGGVATSAMSAPLGYLTVPGYLCGIYQIAFMAPFTSGNVAIGNTGLTVTVK
jgi:uncharacterized protein (TIGR03437 family)